jgi:hypothetical protein
MRRIMDKKIQVGKKYNLNNGLTVTIEGKTDKGNFYGAVAEIYAVLTWDKDGNQITGYPDADIVEDQDEQSYLEEHDE